MAWSSWLGSAALALALFPTSALAADPAAVALVELVRPLLQPASPYNSPPDWSQLDTVKAIRWGAGPVDSDKPSPDGNYFARPGQATLAGRPVQVVATGARTMVMSYYFRNPAGPIPPDEIVAGFKAGGFAVAPARCAINPAQAAPRRWYRISHPKKRAAFFYVGPLASGGQGYTLFTGDELPAMTPAEAAVYTDRCAGR